MNILKTALLVSCVTFVSGVTVILFIFPTKYLIVPFTHMSQKGQSSLTLFTIKIENSNTSKYSTAVAKKEREGKENNACL